jgi:nucleolar protein 14
MHGDKAMIDDGPAHQRKVNHQSADILEDDFIEDQETKALVYKDGILVDSLEAIGLSSNIPKKEDLTVHSNEEYSDVEEEEELEDDDSDDHESEMIHENSAGTWSIYEDATEGDLSEENTPNPSKFMTVTGHLLNSPHYKSPLLPQSTKDEIPFTFDVPSSIEELLKWMEHRSVNDRLIILDRILVCNHVKLAAINHSKMERFFHIMIQYMTILSKEYPVPLMFIDRCAKPIFQLVEQIQDYVASYFRDLLAEYEAKLSNGSRQFPTMDQLILFSWITHLYPTSDFHHLITTPCMLLMSQYLEQCLLNTLQEAISGLFLCSILFSVSHIITLRYIQK